MEDLVVKTLKKAVGPLSSFIINKIQKPVDYIKKYEENMNKLHQELEKLCKDKLDIDDQVKGGLIKLHKITREAASWLEMVRKLTEREEMRKLMKKDIIVAEIAMKMMEQIVLKKLVKKDKELLDVAAQVVKTHQEDDYERIAQVMVEVMKDTTEDFRKLIKGSTKVAVVAVKMLNDEELAMLKDGDKEMAKIVSTAEEIRYKEIWQSGDTDEEESKNVKAATKNVEVTFKEAVGTMLKNMGNLVHDENIQKALPESVKAGLEVMQDLCKREGLIEQIHESTRCCCVVSFEFFHDRYDLSVAAESMLNEIKSAMDTSPKGKVLTRPKRPDELDAIPCGFLQGMESREVLLRKILQALQDDQVTAVGLYGMGGAGKTTLAKEVYNRAKSLFDTIVKVEISEVPNIERIQGDIAEAIGLSLHDVHSLRQRATMLYNRLKPEKFNKESNNDKEKKVGKNVLIILDNAWQKLDFDEVGIPHPNICCKILVTTRDEYVCKAMSVEDVNTLKVGMLIEKEARDLFQAKVGKTLDSTDYKAMTKRLLDKCGGLPLTVVATADALKGKDLSIWRHFADELEKPLSGQVNGVQNETYSILKTSYKIMENEEKKLFFLLVCLYPVGSSVSIEDLMRFGIGLNLFQYVNKLSEAMDQACSWVEELISSSMLLEGDSEGHVRIHDVVRASAISFAAKDKHIFLVEAIPRWMCEETFNKYTAISLLSGQDYSRLDGVKADLLQILLLKGNLSNSSELNGSFFQGMPNLQVLALSYMNLEPSLPDSIGELKNLKTLHLEHCKLRDISLIGKLVKLLVFSLRGSTLEELPDDMAKLCNLRLLDMSGCKIHQTPPNKNIIASLSCLEGLHMFDNFDEWAVGSTEWDGEGTSERTSISNFYELLHLNSLEVHVTKLAFLPIGRFAKNLDKFNICVGRHIDELIRTTKPLYRVLEFSGVKLDSDSDCLEALLKRADCLRFRMISFNNNLVPELDKEGFRELKYLYVNTSFNLKCLISTDGLNDVIAFPNLEYLTLCRLREMEMICDGKAPSTMFSNLRHLNLWGLYKLRYVLPFALLPPRMTEINIDDCKSLEFIFIV